MMSRSILIAALAAAGGSGAALAQHRLADAPAVYSFAATGGAEVEVQNDTLVRLEQSAGDTASFAPLSPTQAAVAASSFGTFGGFSFGATVPASADLATGFLKASVNSFGPNIFGNPAGFAAASLEDRLLFTNRSGSDLAIRFRYSFDGLLVDTNGGGNPIATMGLACLCPASNRCFNAAGVPVRFASLGTTASDSIFAYADEAGIRLFARCDV